MQKCSKNSKVEILGALEEVNMPADIFGEHSEALMELTTS